MEPIEIILAVVTVLGSGAAFKYYESRAKIKSEERLASKPEDVNTLYRDDLKKRVEEMSLALEKANAEILQLTEKVAQLETENKYLHREIDILKRN
jgi:predicted phage gp36 major capsid-like protein